jgi:L-aspartate oxidase
MIRTRSNHITLDMTSLSAPLLKKRFPTIYRTCLSYGINLTREPVPVSPSAHFMMGGVQTGLNGNTRIPGLYAAGEVACTGVHGANRLASNSLLEGLVFGARCALHLIRHSPKGKPYEPRREKLDGSFALLMKRPELGSRELDTIISACKKLMWKHVGIVRNEEGLREACLKIRKWKNGLKGLYLHRQGMEVKNMLMISWLVSTAALRRRESLGAHFRSDYPSPSRKKAHSIFQLKGK